MKALFPRLEKVEFIGFSATACTIFRMSLITPNQELEGVIIEHVYLCVCLVFIVED